MAYNRPASVRSHRRGGPRRRVSIAPWVIVPLILALIGGGFTAGYVWLVKQACSGEVTATIVASPGTATILETLSREWASGEPAVDGRCAAVEISAKDSAETALALQNPWDPKTNGPAPDAWVPQSTAWVRKASADADAERMMPDLQPSIARSPTVLAMPKVMAEKLGWPRTTLTWEAVLAKAANRQGWAAHGQPDWGPFRLGMTDPATSTAGLLTLTALLDADDDEVISDAEQQGLFRFNQSVAVRAERSEQILTEYAKLSAQDPIAGLRYISAFPALEQDVLSHNLRNPRAPLVAVYPEDGSIEADHPFLVLQNTEWAQPQAQRVATAFMAFVRGAQGETQLLDAGYRDSNRVPGKDITVANGLAPEIAALPRGVLLAESVARTVATWTALTRPTNILLVLDVSGSMDEAVPGAGKTRLQLAKEAAKDAVGLFSAEARVGLWEFSSGLSGRTDYRAVVPLDRLGDQVNGRTRKEQMLRSIDNLRSRADTGLYDTTAAAQKFMLDNFQKDAVNLVVVMTDGKNEDPTGGLSFEALRTQLTRNNADANRRVPVATVGFGERADYAILQQIAQITGGLAFESRESFDINQVLMTAIFSDV